MSDKIMTITAREYKATVKTKTFLVSMILVPVMMFAGIIILKLFEDKVDTTDKNISIIDRSGLMAEQLVIMAEERNKTEVYEKKDNGELKKVKPNYFFKIIPPDDENPDKQRYELSEKVRKKEIFSFVEIGKNVIHPQETGGSDFSNVIRYYAEGAALDEVRRWLANPLNNELRQIRMKEAGIDPALVKELMRWVSVNGMGLYSVDPQTGKYIEARESSEGEAILAPMAMMMIMFILSILGAQPLLNSTMEEKSQKISEVILGSCSTFDFMMGKILGGVGASLSAAFVYVGGGIIALKYMGRSDLIPLDLIPWFFAYATLLITMMGAIMAALGSTCNTAKEAQSLAFPGMVPMIVPMMIWFLIVREPLSNFSIIASLIPPLTPMLMLLRQSTPYHIPAWQPWTGLIGVILFTLFSVWASARIFRIGILSSGKAPKLGTIIKWVFKND